MRTPGSRKPQDSCFPFEDYAHDPVALAGEALELLGELSGEPLDRDERKPLRVYKWSAHALRDRLRGEGAVDTMPVDTLYPMAGRAEPPEEPTSRARMTGDGRGAVRGSSPQDLPEGNRSVEGWLEIAESAESTSREDLERERLRAETGRTRADRERERVEELWRGELAADRSWGYWSRLLEDDPMNARPQAKEC